MGGGCIMGENVFFKLVCLDDTDPFEYKIHMDVNRASLDEIHEVVKDNIDNYQTAKWLLLPCTVTM